MQESQDTTVVLVDDHAIVREGIAALCSASGMSILGQCSDGAAAVEMIAALKPDFAILDLNMPGISGIEVIRRLRASGCTAKLMILSISREEITVMEALRAGADAYLLKDGPSATCWMPSASSATAASTSLRCCAAPASLPGPKAPRPTIRWPPSALARRRSFPTL
jgi:DNA-binding NarL/FixJ family response regulator